MGKSYVAELKLIPGPGYIYSYSWWREASNSGHVRSFSVSLKLNVAFCLSTISIYYTYLLDFSSTFKF